VLSCSFVGWLLCRTEFTENCDGRILLPSIVSELKLADRYNISVMRSFYKGVKACKLSGDGIGGPAGVVSTIQGHRKRWTGLNRYNLKSTRRIYTFAS